jgi:hypothetical protein
MILRETLSANMKEGQEFIDKMDKVFANLRSDHDVATLELSKKKIEALKDIHVDVSGDVSSLSVKARESNGVIKGVRGTGKSHLLLISRDKINANKDHICVYINLQEHLNIGGDILVHERFFVQVILKQLKKQLLYLINEVDNPYRNITECALKILEFFGKKNKREKLEETLIEKLNEMEQIILNGEYEIHQMLKEVSKQNQEKVGQEARIKGNYGIKGGGIESELKGNQENSESFSEKYNTTVVLDLATLKTLLLDVIRILGIDGVTFFYDEWSSLSSNDQTLLSKLIRGLSSSPIFHWIAYIPYKSSIGVLERTADMPHTIDLDLQYIYEENNTVCKNYFTSFINNRLKQVFGSDTFKANSLIRPQLLELLVKSSMGNTRDFGVMVNKAWEFFRQDYKSTGRNKMISKGHVKRAIKTLAEEKLENLKQLASDKYSERIWNEIVDFAKLKSNTHFCIELNDRNIDYLKGSEFEDLLYHRLIHLRKKDYPSKEGDGTRLAIYSIDVSAVFFEVFETRSDRKKIKLVLSVDTIHNQVRRYIFDLKKYVDEYRMEQGKQLKCRNCGKITTEEMKLAWDMGVCIYCSTPFSRVEAS